jgi:hypothetical protein
MNTTNVRNIYPLVKYRKALFKVRSSPLKKYKRATIIAPMTIPRDSSGDRLLPKFFLSALEDIYYY